MIYRLETEDMYNHVCDIPIASDLELYEFIKKNKELAIDIETSFSYKRDRVYKATKKSLNELNCFDNKILLLQIGNLKTQFILDCRKVDINCLKAIGTILKTNNNVVVGHNLVYDLHWLKHHYGWELENLYDTFIVEKLLTNGKYPLAGYYGLAAVYKRYYNIDINYGQLNMFEPFAPKKIRDQFPAITDEDLKIEHLTYSRYDVILPIRIKHSHKNDPNYKSSSRVIAQELRYLQCLVDQKLEGINIDLDKWSEALVKPTKALIEVKEELLKLADINWNSPKQKLEYYEALGIKLEDRKGKASSGMEALKTIADTLVDDENNRVAYNTTELLLNYGKISKQVNAYGTKFLRYINRTTSKIHPDTNQLMSTGRVSSSNPNGNNIPRSNDYRNAFYREEGLSMCDYSSMEVRRVAELAKEKTLIFNLNNGNDPHAESAEKIFGKEFMQALYDSGVPRDNNKYRSIGKTLNFSIIYGVSAWKLSKDYKVSVKDAQKWIDSWFRDNPNITKWLFNTRFKSIKQGFIEIDKLGRRYYFAEIERYRLLESVLSDPYKCAFLNEIQLKALRKEIATIKGNMERKSGNYVVQGSCASITKTAQILLHIKGIRTVLQVYDEIVVVGDHKEALKEAMESAWNMFNSAVKMPLKSEYGNCWKK